MRYTNYFCLSSWLYCLLKQLGLILFEINYCISYLYSFQAAWLSSSTLTCPRSGSPPCFLIRMSIRKAMQWWTPPRLLFDVVMRDEAHRPDVPRLKGRPTVSVAPIQSCPLRQLIVFLIYAVFSFDSRREGRGALRVSQHCNPHHIRAQCWLFKCCHPIPTSIIFEAIQFIRGLIVIYSSLSQSLN